MNNLLISHNIEFKPPLDNGLSFIIAILILFFTAYSIKNLLSNLSLKVKIFLSMLRILAVLLFLFIFFQPSIVKTTYYLEKDTIAILIDASRSMTHKSDSKNRLDIAKEVARDILSKEEARKEHNFVIYSFSKNNYLESNIKDIKIINEDSTDILNSLENTKLKHQDLSNIILISDGADNNILHSRKEDTNIIIKKFSKNLEVPVHTILTGTEREINDISVRIVSASPVGFIGKEFEIVLKLSNNSQTTDSIQLSIKENDIPVYSNRYKVLRGKTEDITITLYPKSIGRNVYEVSATPFSDEEFTENNRDYFISKIKKENIRILQITGSVSYDVRFLRHLFKKAPDIDLVSFFILRTLQSDVNAPDYELSLIPFPTDQIIRENLFTFDAVIFQDFGFVPYGLNSTFSDLNIFIKKGGALIFITGNNWYHWIGDFITFFDECMPGIPRTDDNAIENIIYKPELTADGKRHPVTRLLESREENNLLFKNLPELHGIHRLSSIKPTSATLLSAKISDKEDLPLLLLNRCGKGKTALITTDELWRFSFSEKTPDEFNLYNRFMNNLILWITGEPDKEDIILSHRKDLKSSDKLKGRYAGIVSTPEISLTTEDGTVIKGNIESGGDFLFDISGIPPGMHSGKISYQNEVYNIFFFKKRDDIEMQEIFLRPDILKGIAKYSGGRYFADKSDIKNLRLIKKQIKKIQDTKRTPLWNRTILFVILIVLFSAEWYFRRMYGHQ